MTEAKRPKGTLTIYDVARLAGVSIASVSRVLNGQGTPRPDTRERVMREVLVHEHLPVGVEALGGEGLATYRVHVVPLGVLLVGVVRPVAELLLHGLVEF